MSNHNDDDDPLAGTGLTEGGFVAPREDQLKQKIRQEYERRTGESPDWDETEFLGAMSAATAKTCAESAEQMQDLYEARDPRQASGVHLEAIALLTGVDRRPATRGVALVLLGGEPGTVVPAGKEVRGGGPRGETHWAITEDKVIGYRAQLVGGFDAGDTCTIQAGGSEVSVDAQNDVQTDDEIGAFLDRLAAAAETLPGTPSARAVNDDSDEGGDVLELGVDPTDPIEESTVDIEVTGSGGAGFVLSTGAYALVEATSRGELLAPVGAIDEIATPVKGWTSVSHYSTTPGRGLETDEQLRARRQQSLAAAGARSNASIRANLLQLDFIRSAIVEDNPKDVPDTVAGYQLDPHSFIVVLWPATLTDEQKMEVAHTLWEVKPMGIPTQASDPAATDSATIKTDDGVEHEVSWVYATQILVDVEVQIELKVGYQKYEAEQPIEHEVTKYLNSVGVGERVRRSKLFGRLDDIEGIEAVTNILLDGAEADVKTGKGEVPTLAQSPTVSAP